MLDSMILVDPTNVYLTLLVPGGTTAFRVDNGRLPATWNVPYPLTAHNSISLPGTPLLRETSHFGILGSIILGCGCCRSQRMVLFRSKRLILASHPLVAFERNCSSGNRIILCYLPTTYRESSWGSGLTWTDLVKCSPLTFVTELRPLITNKQINLCRTITGYRIIDSTEEMAIKADLLYSE